MYFSRITGLLVCVCFIYKYYIHTRRYLQIIENQVLRGFNTPNSGEKAPNSGFNAPDLGYKKHQIQDRHQIQDEKHQIQDQLYFFCSTN